MTKTQAIVRAEQIESRILLIRGQKEMLDRDLAALYGVKPIALRQQVKRNKDRFPKDFMFHAFTEQSVAMLSSVLRSKRAVHVNIQIMRAFVKLREMLATHRELARKLPQLEKRIEGHDEEITAIFEAIRQLMEPPDKSSKRIGFHG